MDPAHQLECKPLKLSFYESFTGERNQNLAFHNLQCGAAAKLKVCSRISNTAAHKQARCIVADS